MVLTSSGGASREALNQLCAEARLTLGPLENPPIGDHSCPLAIVAIEGETRIFMRSGTAGGEAMIFVCEEEINVAQLLPDAHACLAELN